MSLTPTPIDASLVTRGEEKTGDDVNWIENTLVAAILRLPDKEWPANWDFLAQSMLRVAFHRGNGYDPKNGKLTTEYILEQLLEKRKLLPETVDSASIAVVACTELYRRYYVSRQYKKAIELSKTHFEALNSLESGQIVEQQSLVIFQMAACYNMLRDRKLAEDHLRAAFSFLQLEKLPPHRFKAHLIRLISLCHHHQLIDGTPSGSYPFLIFARAFYDELNTKLAGLVVDNPWNRIIDDIEVQLKQNLADTKDMIETQRSMAMDIENEGIRKAQAVAEWTEEIAPNPNYTINDKIAALRTLVLQFELTEKEHSNLKKLIRMVRAANALPEDFVPSSKKSTRTRF